jgi:glycosyltransferase involved in cell wall biosynthesis
MARKLKVFEVLECGTPHGVGRQIAAICGNLNHDLFEFWVVYAVRPGYPAEEFERLLADADRCIHVPEMVRQVSPLKDAAAFWKLYRLMRREKPDVVHAHSSKAGVLARFAAWLAGVPRILYSPHGYGFLQQDVGPAKRALYWLFELATSWIGTIVSTSHGEARRAERLSWGKKVHVVYNLFLMEDTPAPSHTADGSLTVGALGRISYARNPEAFVRMAARVSKRFPSTRFLWMGGGELEEALKLEVRRMGLEGLIELTGHIDRADLLDRLARLDVFVHFSRWEGSPTSILEAMHFAKPVVASKIAGNEDLVEPGVTGFLATDEEELAACVERLLDSAEMRRRLGLAGRDRLDRSFSLRATSEALQSLYLGKPAGNAQSAKDPADLLSTRGSL